MYVSLTLDQLTPHPNPTQIDHKVFLSFFIIKQADLSPQGFLMPPLNGGDGAKCIPQD